VGSESSGAQLIIKMGRPVRELRDILGARLVAYIGGSENTNDVQSWVDNITSPDPGYCVRLLFALDCARLVTQRDDNRVAQAWFQGINPSLSDHSPARMLRNGDPERAVQAAKHMAANG
jgi:hypothetical protein